MKQNISNDTNGYLSIEIDPVRNWALASG